MIAHDVRHARTFAERTRGLLGRAPLGPGEALVIHRARQVHTIGMRYAIDVCFCDRGWRVLHVVRGLPPRRLTRWIPRAFYAVETLEGELAGVTSGTQLSLEELNER